MGQIRAVCLARWFAANNDPTLYSAGSLAACTWPTNTLQFGAFQDRNGALDMLVKLKAAGVDAKNPPPTDLRDGKVWYLVQSGK